MRVTVLPVRDPELPEKPLPRASWPVREIPGEGPDDAAEASVELLRAPREMPASTAPRSAVFAPGPPPRGGASSSGAAAPPGPTSPSPAPAEPAPPAMMEITLTNGRVLRVPPGIGRAELEAVLAVASGEASPRPPPPPPKRSRR